MPDSSTNTIIGLGAALGITLIWAIANQVKLKSLLSTTATPTGPNAFVEFLETWFGLTPYVFFFAGFIIDAINTQYQYSKASIVGLVALLVVTLFGSDTYASLSSKIVGFLPSMKTPAATPGFPDTWNITGILIWLVLGVVVFLPMMIGGLSGWAWGSSVSVAALFIITVLAGNNLIGDTITAVQTNRAPINSTFANLTHNDVCITPGMASIQTKFAPPGIVLSTSILTSHMFESIDTGNTTNAAITGALTLVSFAIEYGILLSNNCLQDYKYGMFAPILSLLLGTGAGAAGYWTMKQVDQESFTSSDQSGGVFHPLPSAPKKSQSKTDTKIVVGPQPDVSEPVDDQDAFVCEAYKDGELVTSTIVD